MAVPKSNFLDKVLVRIGRLDKEGLETVVQRLARERNFLETLFNAIEDGVLVLDESGRILYSNRAMTVIFGPHVPFVDGQHIDRLLPELDWTALARADVQGGTRVTRHELELSYPRQRFLSIYAAPLDGGARGSSGVALIIHDATEARAKTFAAIETERVQALTLLAASVAHEIGNPLNALHIHLQLMEREVRKLRTETTPVRKELRQKSQPMTPRKADVEETAQKLEKYLGVAKGEIARLDNIITQFLQALRPAPVKLAMTNVNSVVQETLELLRPEIENRGLSVDQRLSSNLAPIAIDSRQIKQALVNLVKNAIQAMTKGGTLTLRTDQGSEGVVLTVADTGGGIPDEKINRIFEPFYTTKKKGSGLGLMIVQRIIRDHGGRIELESRVNQGTTFRIWLPMRERRPKLLAAAREVEGTDR